MTWQTQFDFGSDESHIWENLDAARQQQLITQLAKLWIQFALDKISVNDAARNKVLTKEQATDE